MSRKARDWGAARAKVEAEGRCRACHTTSGLQACHIIPRSRVGIGLGGEDPRNIVVLCQRCHDLQHAGKLELLGILTLEEQSYAVGLVGIEEARRRTIREAA